MPSNGFPSASSEVHGGRQSFIFAHGRPESKDLQDGYELLISQSIYWLSSIKIAKRHACLGQQCQLVCVHGLALGLDQVVTVSLGDNFVCKAAGMACSSNKTKHWLHGLAVAWEEKYVVRSRVRDTHVLVQWVSAAATGVPSMSLVSIHQPMK